LVTIEEAEARLQRLVEVRALFVGLAIGVVASFIVTLAVPVHVLIQQGFVVLSIGVITLGPVRSGDYYVGLIVIGIVFVVIATWKVKQVYGLTEKIDRFSHTKDRAEVAQKLAEELKGLGQAYGQTMKQGVVPQGSDLFINFITADQKTEVAVWVLRVEVSETDVRLRATIDRGSIAFAKDVRARIINYLYAGQVKILSG
jgi:hypothetical protein